VRSPARRRALGARKGADVGEQHDVCALEAGYERLRAAVLGAAPDGFRLGHGVLATRGLVAWTHTASSLAAPPSSASGSAHPPAGEVVSLPGADQLVAVIAQMALAHAA
jgi:hypothetical protein